MLAGAATYLNQEPGTDRGRTIADQQGDVVPLGDLAAVRDHRTSAAKSLLRQGIVHRSDRQQDRQRNPSRLGPHPSVGEDQNRRGLRAHRLHRGAAELGERVGDRPGTRRSIAGNVQDHRGWQRACPFNCRQLVRRENRRVETPLRVDVIDRKVLVCVWSRAQVDAEIKRPALPDRIDRRVGDHRDNLLEVARKRRAGLRKQRQRTVITHPYDRLFAFQRHVANGLDPIAGPAKQSQQSLRRGGDRARANIRNPAQLTFGQLVGIQTSRCGDPTP